MGRENTLVGPPAREVRGRTLGPWLGLHSINLGCGAVEDVQNLVWGNLRAMLTKGYKCIRRERETDASRNS